MLAPTPVFLPLKSDGTDIGLRDATGVCDACHCLASRGTILVCSPLFRCGKDVGGRVRSVAVVGILCLLLRSVHP